MTAFLNRALNALNRVYRFRGGINTLDQLDLSGPIQPVHDVSREAELSSGLGNSLFPGWWWIGPQHVHAGSDEKYSLTDPRGVIASFTAFGPLPDALDVWWYGAFAYSTVDIISAANLIAVYPSGVPGQSFAGAELLFQGTASLSTCAQGSAAGFGFSATSLGTQPRAAMPPLLLPEGTTLNARTLALAAVGNIAVVSRCWVGPKGVRPPGSA